MKKQYKGETAKPIPGTVSSPKAMSNHGTIQNAGTNSKEVELKNVPGSILPDPKKA